MAWLRLIIFTILTIAVVADQKACFKELQNIFLNNTAELAQMYYYSGKDINDLGQFTECNRLPNAKYALFIVYTKLTTFLLGVCGPESCTPEDYSSDIATALKAFNVSEEVYSAESVTVVDSQQFNDKPYDGAAIATLIFLFVLGGIVALGTFVDRAAKSTPDKRLRG